MSYLYWLIGISLAFILLERLFPWRRQQRPLRPGWMRDVGFLALNGHFFSLLTAGVTGGVALGAIRALHLLGIQLECLAFPTVSTGGKQASWGDW